MLSDIETNFWIIQLITVSSVYFTTYLLGLVIIIWDIRVNYTRKGVHFLMFFLPPIVQAAFPYETSVVTFILGCMIILMVFLPFMKGIRSRLPFFETAFKSFDRPEDRPHTLMWATTQIAGIYIAVLIVIAMFLPYERMTLIAITTIVASIGDGLAEPIGVRFGRHKYNVKAFCSNRTYTRSIEGSCCVLITGVCAIVSMQQNLNEVEFIIALLIIPIVLTLTEALSPHTWDGPFIMLAGGVSTIAVIEVAEIWA